MPPSLFNFKELRRRSRASFRTDRSTDTSSNDSHGTTPTTGSLTPPSIGGRSDPALDLQVKETIGAQQQAQARPPPQPVQIQTSQTSNRHSVSGMTGLGSPMANRNSTLPVSQYAPRITNVTENAWVYQKVLLINGTVGDPAQQTVDGTLIVSRLDDNFPPVNWPVCDSHFKALVYLQPGPNRIRFEFSSPKLANSSSSNPIHSSYLTVHMLPPTGAPPLQLAILLAKDSPGTFDAVPARIEREGNGLETAIRKFRMAAYLWQAFTAEQMWRNKLGRRAFRFEEDWTTGSVNYRDREMGTMRSEARIHVIRTDKTVAEIRDLDRAQQNKDAKDKGGLCTITADACKEYFKPLPGQKQYVSVMILDAHWDAEAKTITGHAALSRNAGDLHLAVFGSHCLQSYPTSFEEVVPAFTDCTPTDTSHVANDCNDAGSSWEAANIGIGAHLHEVGHLFGCPHQEKGVMLRDYVTLSRTFVPREAYCTRTRSKGGVVLQGDECGWHRLDCLRFRSHPCFKLPNDPALHPDDSIQAYPVDGGTVMVMSATGMSSLEIFGEGDDVCRAWLEYPLENGAPQRQVAVCDSELRARLPEAKRQGKMRVRMRSHGGGSVEFDDFKQLASKTNSFKLSNGKTGYRSQKFGLSKTQGSEPTEVIFSSALKQNRVLSRIVFYHDSSCEGMEFVYDDNSTQLFGKKGGKGEGSVFELDVRRGEYISGFIVRSGWWIDAVQVLTTLGRKSPFYGNAHGGSSNTLIPPRGYNVVGVSGTCGEWVDGISIVITKGL